MGHVHALLIASRDSIVRVGSVLTTKSLGSHALTHMSVVVSGCVFLTIVRAIWGCVLGISVLNLGITTHGKEFIIK
jgi:predicted benzoate:H+ symporter BenE